MASLNNHYVTSEATYHKKVGHIILDLPMVNLGLPFTCGEELLDGGEHRCV